MAHWRSLLVVGSAACAVIGVWLIRRSKDAEDDSLHDCGAEDLISRMPKVELHVHFDGSFDAAALFAEVKARMASGCSDLPAEVQVLGQVVSIRRTVESCKTGEEFRALVTCRGRKGLHEILRCFEVYLPIVRGRLLLLEELAFRFVERQAAQNVIYTEVRYSPHLLADSESAIESTVSGFSGGIAGAEAVLAAVTRGLRRGEQTFGVTVNQILCCLCFRPDWAGDVIKLAASRRHDWPCAVVGIDVAGGEDWYDPTNRALHEPTAAALKAANELGLNITLHAGEATSAANVEAAIFDYGAARVGHGYSIVRDPPLLARAIAKGVHFECCPTSSRETGGWFGSAADAEDWSDHPAVALVRAGASVSLNSDDPAVFACSLTEELALAASGSGGRITSAGQTAGDCTGQRDDSDEKTGCREVGMGLGLAGLQWLALKAAGAAFLPIEQRELLKARLLRYFGFEVG